MKTDHGQVVQREISIYEVYGNLRTSASFTYKQVLLNVSVENRTKQSSSKMIYLV